MSFIAGNLFQLPSASTGREVVETLLQSDACRIERIESHGESSPEDFWYDQPEDEWVLLLKGAATLSFTDEEKIELKPGDYLLIPAHRKHRVERTSMDALWLAIHLT